MLLEPLIDQLQDFPRYRVRGEVPWLGHLRLRPVLAETAPVLLVEIPVAALGSAGFCHENSMTLPHLPVIILQADGFPSLRPFAELFRGIHEMPVLANLKRAARLPANFHEVLQDSPFPGLRADDFPRLQGVEGVEQQFLQSAVAGIELMIPDGNPFPLQSCAEVAHGRKEVGDAHLAGPDVACLAGRFRHPDEVTFPVEAGQRGGVHIQLIPEDHDKLPKFPLLPAHPSASLSEASASRARSRPALCPMMGPG